MSKTVPPKYDIKPMGETKYVDKNEVQLITKCDLFSVNRYKCTNRLTLNVSENSFMHILVIDGKGTVDGRAAKKATVF